MSAFSFEPPVTNAVARITGVSPVVRTAVAEPVPIVPVVNVTVGGEV